MAASTPLPFHQGLTGPGSSSSTGFPKEGQELRIKNTLLMAAAYRAGDDNKSGSTSSPQSTFSLLGTNNPINPNIMGSGEGSVGNNHSGMSSRSAPPPPAPVEQRSISGGAGVSEMNEDDHNLRTTCDGCTISKIKCDGGHPCKRCQRRRVECVYREKKRCGPKRRRSQRDDSGDDSDAMAGMSEDGSHSISHKVLSLRERQFLAKFYNSVNKFIPVTCHTVLRDAMNPLPLDVIDGITASEAEKNVHHARKAVLLGCVALGAVFCGDAASSGAYMAQAQIHLKDCFDALLPEVVSCYLVMVIYHLHFLDRSKVFRYIGFAQQAFRELRPSQQASDGYVRDSVRMLSTFLHVACDSDIRVEEIGVLTESSPEPGSNTHSRILAVFSYVLLMLHRRSNRIAAAKASPNGKPLPSLASLAAMADDADLLLTMVEDPGSFAIIVMKTLRGYFLLLKGRDQEVQGAVGIPVAKALEADHGVLHFPLCWHMCQCVSAFLHRRGVHDAAAGMERVMEPLRQTLAFSSSCCSVALDVFDVYAGKGTAAPHSGLFSHPSRVQSAGPPSNIHSSGAGGGASSSGREEHRHGSSDRSSSRHPRDYHSSLKYSPSSSTAGASSPTRASSAAAASSQGRAGTRQSTSHGSGCGRPEERDPQRQQGAAGGAGAGSGSHSVDSGAAGPWGMATSSQHQRQPQQQQQQRGSSNGGRAQSTGAHGMSAGVTHGQAGGIIGSLADSPLFGSRFTGGASGTGGSGGGAGVGGGSSLSAPSSAPSLSPMGLEDVGALQRGHNMMFDLGSQQSSFELEGRKPSDPFAPNGFTLAEGLSGVGVGGAGPAGRSGGGPGGGGAGGGAGAHNTVESAGSSPLDAGLSSEHSPTRPAGAADVDTDSGDSGLMTGILDM